MRKLFLGVLLCAIFLGASAVPPALAQTSPASARLTLLLDYRADLGASGLEVDGIVTSKNLPDLGAWGITVTRQPWQADDGATWYVHGDLRPARLEGPDPKGSYSLHLGPLSLSPGETLTLVVPFVDIDYRMVSPAPENYPAIAAAKARGDFPPGLLGLAYTAPAGRVLEVEIPFTPLSRAITLNLTPLVGEMLTAQSNSFRLSGKVVFDRLLDFGEFKRYCESDPASPYFRYRAADLLIALDALPALSGGYLSGLYQFKPTYVLVSSEVSGCQYASGQGRVEASFSGRNFNHGATAFPPDWQDTAEVNRSIPDPAGSPEYELQLGQINLGPQDVLTINLPQAQVRRVNPPPTRLDYQRGHTEITYQGPQRFTLVIGYWPEPDLLLGQLALAARAPARQVENLLKPLTDPSGALLTWGLLIAGLALLGLAFRVQRRVLRGLAYLLLGLALIYGLRGVYGLLVLAVIIFWRNEPFKKGSWQAWLRPAAALAMILGAMLIDRSSIRLFIFIGTLQLDMTPLTPLILLVLGATLAGWLVLPQARSRKLSSTASLGVILGLAALATFDALQKSLVALVLLGAGLAYLAWRMGRPQLSPTIALDEIGRRLALAWRSRIIPVGTLLMVLFAFQNGLQSTNAILSNSLGLWGRLVALALLIVSIFHGLLATGVLFIAIYPLLPFKSGYLKAITFSAFVLLVFITGTGSDDRLISTLGTLIAGRLVYYLSVPLLVGLYFDVDRFRHSETAGAPAGEPAQPAPAPLAALSGYFKQVQGLATSALSIASLVAPGLAAYLTGTPVVTTYFDLLQKIFSLTLPS